MKARQLVVTVVALAIGATASWAGEPGDNAVPAAEVSTAQQADEAPTGAVMAAAAQPGMPLSAPAGDAAAGTGPAPTSEEEGVDSTTNGGDTAIPDPIEPVNRVMFEFNDKLYYWFMKPVAQGYAFIAPEDLRVSVRNFFNNATMPVRFVNCVLQGKVKGAGNELARFGINTILGFGGFIDTAKRGFDIGQKNEDLGQTLGVYGMPPLMYIVWPFLGPSSVRDTIGFAGDSFLNPINYIPNWGIEMGLHGYNQINRTSLAIGDYEDIVEASVEPYISVRDAYVQNRNKAIRE